MRVQEYLRINMVDSNIANTVERVFDASGGYVTVKGLKKALKDVVGHDPTKTVRLDEREKRQLIRGGSQDGDVYYLITKGTISAIDYYRKR